MRWEREGAEYRLSKEDMSGTEIGKDGGGGDRAQEGRLGRVVVGFVRFQSGEWVRVRKARDRCGRY